jgi:hypothetical protein
VSRKRNFEEVTRFPPILNVGNYRISIKVSGYSYINSTHLTGNPID